MSHSIANQDDLAISATATCVDNDPGEYLTVLFPTADMTAKLFLGKVFARGEDGSLHSSVPNVKWFDASAVPVATVRALHEAVVGLARGPRPAALVAGALADPSRDREIRRLKGRTVVDRPSRVLTEDRDKFPNPLGLDPRTRGAAAARWMDGLLPPALRRAAASHAWSSSCCVGAGEGPPAILSAAVRRMGNRPMDEAERVAILRGLDRWVKAALAERGIDPGPGGVDHRTGFATQLQYTSPPRLPEGMDDPLGDARWLFLEGEATFDVDALLAELAPFLGKPRKAGAAGARKPKERAEPAAVPALPDEVVAGLRRPEGAAVLPLDVAAVLARRARMLGDRAFLHLPRERCGLAQGYALVVLDMVEWVRARVAWGATVPELREWHAAGGVPPGRRNDFMLVLHSSLAYALGGRGAGGRTFRETVAAVAALCIAGDWADREWWGSGAHGSVSERIARDAAGEQVEWNGSLRSPIYSYKPATIRALLGIHPAECEALDLGGLGDRALRLRAKRRAAGRPSRDAKAAGAAALVERARAMRASGASIRATAEAVGRSETWVKKNSPRPPESGLALTTTTAEGVAEAGFAPVTPCAPLREGETEGKGKYSSRRRWYGESVFRDHR